MVIDAHVHIAFDQNSDYPHCTIDNVLKEMDRSGIEKCLAFPLTQCGVEDNLSFLHKIEEYPDRFIPMIYVNPIFLRKGEIMELLNAHGVFGVKINPREGQYDCRYRSILKDLMECVDKLHKHLVISYTSDDNYIDAGLIEELANEYRNCTVQIGHMGSIYDCSRTIDMAKRMSHVYLDSCSASVNALRRAIRECPDKLFMGCDFPFGTFDAEKTRIREACRLAEREDRYSDIAGDNFKALLNLQFR